MCFSRWARPFAPVIFRCRSSTICSARFVRISRRIATTRGRACSTTAADRRIRSAGSCCASPATTTRALDRSSDALCTALQLTNFWQDLDRDWQNGRLYVPLDDVDAERRAHAGSRRSAADRAVAARRCAASRRARALSFDAGREVCDGVRGRLRLRAARDVARRHAHSRPARARRLRRVHVQADARRRPTRRRCCGALLDCRRRGAAARP